MPHTSRRKKPSTAVTKLVNVSSDDGWTTVRRKGDLIDPNPPRQPRGRFKNASPEQMLERLSLDQATPLLKGGNNGPWRPREPQITEDSQRQRFETISKSWVECSARRDMMKMLELQVPSHLPRQVKRLVCLGIGSLSTDWNTHGRRSAWQLAVFMDLAGHFKSLTQVESSMELFVQDPVLNHVDQSFMLSMGIETLEHPQAFHKINKETFVFAPHYPVAAWPKEMLCGNASLCLANDVAQALPSLPDQHELESLWKDWRPADGLESIPDKDLKSQLEAFLQTHCSIAFHDPGDLAPHTFNSLRFYWDEQIS